MGSITEPKLDREEVSGGEVSTLAHHGISEISVTKTAINQFIDRRCIEAPAAATTTADLCSIGLA